MNTPLTPHDQSILQLDGALQGYGLAPEPGWPGGNILIPPELLPVPAMNLRRIASSGHAALRYRWRPEYSGTHSRGRITWLAAPVALRATAALARHRGRHSWPGR